MDIFWISTMIVRTLEVSGGGKAQAYSKSTSENLEASPDPGLKAAGSTLDLRSTPDKKEVSGPAIWVLPGWA